MLNEFLHLIFYCGYSSDDGPLLDQGHTFQTLWLFLLPFKCLPPLELFPLNPSYAHKKIMKEFSFSLEGVLLLFFFVFSLITCFLWGALVDVISSLFLC